MSNYDEIAKRAYELWENAGKPSGQETEHWTQAENEIMQRQQGKAALNRPLQSANDRGRRVAA